MQKKKKGWVDFLNEFLLTAFVHVQEEDIINVASVFNNLPENWKLNRFSDTTLKSIVYVQNKGNSTSVHTGPFSDHTVVARIFCTLHSVKRYYDPEYDHEDNTCIHKMHWIHLQLPAVKFWANMLYICFEITSFLPVLHVQYIEITCLVLKCNALLDTQNLMMKRRV